MSNGTKVYNIKINGLTESVTAADALVAKLDQLQARLDALSKAGVTKIGGTTTRTNQELSEQEKLLNKIAEAEGKIEQARDINYKYLLKLKEELKEINVEQKAAASADRLNDGGYDLKTMAGIKQQLKDIKQLMQTTDIDSDMFTELTKQANELNSKLLEIEKSYGQFGRNVGNYSSALSGLSSITVVVGETEVQFKNATEAARELKRQMDSLATSGKKNTEEYKNLQNAYKKVRNSIRGISNEMDELLNSFQSVGAIASISGGLSAFFGFDNTAIDRSIQKLVALQNVLQGIETIRRQMEVGTGLGNLLAKGSNAVDRFVASITKAKITTDGLTMSSKNATTAVRALSTALKGIGVGFILAGITSLLSLLTKVTDAMADGVKKADAFSARMKILNENFVNRKDLLEGAYIRGAITQEEYLNQTIKAQNDYIKDNIDLIKERNNAGGFVEKAAQYFGGKGINVEQPIPSTGIQITNTLDYDYIKTIDEAIAKWKELNDELQEGRSLLGGVVRAVASEQTKAKEQVSLGNAVLAQFLKDVQAVEEVNALIERDSKKNTNLESEVNAVNKQINELKAKLTGSSDNALVLRSVLLNLDKYIKDDNIKQSVTNIIATFNDLADSIDTTSAKFAQADAQWQIDKMSEGYAKRVAQLKKAQKEEEQQWANNAEALNAIRAKYAQQQSELWKEEKEARASSLDEIKQMEVDKMREGLRKTLAQLNLEKNARIREAVASERDVQAKIQAIDELYRQKEIDAYRDWANEIKEIYNDLWTDLYRNEVDVTTLMNNALRQGVENEFERERNKISAELGRTHQIGGYKFDSASLSKEARNLFAGDFTKEVKDFAREYGNILTNIEVAQNDINYVNKRIEKLSNFLKENEKEISESLKATYENNISEYQKISSYTEKLLEKFVEVRDAMMDDDIYKEFGKEVEGAVKHLRIIENIEYPDLGSQYVSRIASLRQYYTQLTSLQEEYVRDSFLTDEKQLNNQYEFERQEEMRNFQFLQQQYDENEKAEIDGLLLDENYKKKREEIHKKYSEMIEAATEQHLNKLEALEKEKNESLIALDLQATEVIQKTYNERYQGLIREYQNFSNKLKEIMGNQPVLDRSGWQIVDVKATRERNKEVLDGAKKLAKDIENEKLRLQKALEQNQISFDDFKTANEQLNQLQSDVQKTVDEVKQSGKNLIGEFISSINTYVQALGQGLQTVLGAIADYEDSVYQKRIEELENYISEYEKKLQEQEEITQKYADNVNSIEDELSNARGDRRQQLIDMLNAQKAAQRASLAEEKRIEKEKERLEKQKEEEEKKQKKREHQRAVTDAIISAALAVVNGLATKPFVPVGIAMGALAASLGAVQVALIKAQKYKEGGLLQGKSHREGGVKVLGGRAEVEGGEYITNKVTTTKNIELLDFINSKKKKIDLSDMVDFYGGKVSKTLANVAPKVKFANGGQIPTLRSDIDVNSRLIQAMEAYAERPTVVSVVEIENASQRVKNVRAIAGIED